APRPACRSEHPIGGSAPPPSHPVGPWGRSGGRDFIGRMSIEESPAGIPRTIVVLDYDPRWLAAFEDIRRTLEEQLAGLGREICHVGSTSVSGLCAKPKIDVDIVMRSAAAIPQGIERLKALGYACHGDRYKDGMWAFTIGRGSYGERLYLCAPGTPTHLRRLLFRDHLRNHPEAAAAYGALKRRLAAEAVNDWDHYTGGKGPFVADVVRRAAADSIQAVTVGRGGIAREGLDDLPEWFGIPEATDAYVADAEDLPMRACLAPDGSPLGFISIKRTSEFAAEVHAMGVKRAWHRCGIGRALMEGAREFAINENVRFLTVKTLSPTRA